MNTSELEPTTSVSVNEMEGDVIEILPMEEYSSMNAKMKASISWILHKAYKDQLPSEFINPFYESADEVLHVKPRLINLMTTSELYCQACSNMFGDSSSQWQGHWSIIQILSRKGIYVTEPNETAVTETTLMKTAPFNLNAHLALIDSLMLAYMREVVTIERVVKAVRHFATFNASSELPSSTEDAVIFWLNKVCTTVQYRINCDQKENLLQGQSNQKVRIVSKSSQSLMVPVVEDLLQDIGDGCSLAVLVSFYCPEMLRQQDICLKENVGIADSLYNLRLVKSFCQDHVPGQTFHLTYEDFLYTHNSLQTNILILLAELFYWFEVQKLDCVRDTARDDHASRPTTAKSLSSASLSQVPPVSNVTKQSFRKSHMDDMLSPTSPVATGGHVPPRQPLLYKRHQQGSKEAEAISTGSTSSSKPVKRCHSFSSTKDRHPTQQSVIAWQENVNQQSADRPLDSSQLSHRSNLLANVSMDSEMNDSFGDDRLGSMDLELSDSTPPPTLPSNEQLRDPHHPDYIEVQSVTPGDMSTRMLQEGDKKPEDQNQEVKISHDTLLQEFSNKYNTTGDQNDNNTSNIEPLLPARLKPRKEISNNHSKEMERGDKDERQRAVTSPSGRVLKGMESISSSGVSEVSSEIDRVTPLPDEMLSGSDGEMQSEHKQRYAAFTVNAALSQDAFSPREALSARTNESVKLSYTVADHGMTVETAKAAGIPVVGESGEISVKRWGSRGSSLGREMDEGLIQHSGSREGSIASSRSSGDFSDHESHKIHRDHKVRESVDSKDKQRESSVPSIEENEDSEKFIIKKPSLIVKKGSLPQQNVVKKIMTTNFAEIKRMKNIITGNVDNSGSVYMQHGQELGQEQNKKGSTISRSMIDNTQNVKNSDKRTTFASLPNRSTSDQALSRTSQMVTSDITSPMSGSSGSPSSDSTEGMQPVLSELTQIRLKLEEKRKMIERKKQRNEVQQQKVRQKLGKTAFLNVIGKTHSETEEGLRNGESKKGHVDYSQGQSSSRPSGAENIEERSNMTRAFSREGIQQTIENVRKKWFTDEESSEPASSHERSESKREDGRIDPSIVSSNRESPCKTLPHYRVEAKVSPPKDQEYSTRRGDTRVATSPPRAEVDKDMERSYNEKLDHLDRSINSLKGEIQQMSLNSAKELQKMNTPERAVFGGVTNIQRLPQTGLAHQHTPHIVPQSGVTGVHTPMMGLQPSLPGYQTTPHMSATQQPSHSLLNTMQHMNSLHQFSPVSTSTVPYSGFAPNSQPHQPLPPQSHFSPPQLHQLVQSPPQPYPGLPSYQTPPVQPHSHLQMYSTTLPYTINASPQQFNLPPPQAAAYAVGSSAPYTTVMSSSYGPASPNVPLTHTGAQLFSSPDKQSNISANISSPSRPEDTSHVPPVRKESHTENVAEQPPRSYAASSDKSDFFVSFHEGSPKCSEVGKDKLPSSTASLSDQAAMHESSLQTQDQDSDQSRNVSGIVGDESGNLSGTDADKSANQSGVGFVVGQEESSLTQSTEDEMIKRKEKLIQQQIKRREEQERKRQYKEIELARRREQERIKNEEAEKRRAEERSRREQIFKQYQEKKHQEDEESTPQVRRRAKSRDKPRPKSMFTKNMSGSEEGLHSMNSSVEDVSAQAFVISPGHTSQALSCNMLTNASNEGRLTFRRPPSPDIGRVKGRGAGSSTTSSDTGSFNGSDYTGPKLFVKPSSKSNRHIIINSLSQCVLAGPVNADQKSKVLEVLAKSDGKHFLILFRDHSCQYRGLYIFDPDTEDTFKIHGVGPKVIANKMIERFYKYNSGGKSFSEVTSTKHLSVSIDAVVLHNALWKTTKTTTKK